MARINAEYSAAVYNKPYLYKLTMKIFAYADETTFNLNKTNSSVVGSGILLTEKEIDQSVIESALRSLKSETIYDKNDLKTLDKGYFHSSADSKSAHWHLCDSINKAIHGFFKYSYHNQSLSKKKSSIEDLNKRTLELVAIPLIDYKFEEVTLIIELLNVLYRNKLPQKL
jgi:hypothetical protein